MNNKPQAEKWDYIIDGKQNGLARIIIMSVISVFFTVLTIDQLKPEPGKLLIVALAFCSISVISIVILVIRTVRYFWFKINIGEDGFFFQSTPFDSKYYRYTDISSCEEQPITSRHRPISGSGETSYHYYFKFTINEGERKKVKFEKSVHQHEFEILKRRMNSIR